MKHPLEINTAVVSCTNKDNFHFSSLLDNQLEIHCIIIQYISGWLFERNRVIGRYFKITLTIILLSWSY